MSILPKLIYNFSVLSTEIPRSFFMEFDELLHMGEKMHKGQENF